MSLTINSAASPFCSPVQFTTLYDWRPFAQLVVDNDVPPADTASFQASLVLMACLQVAGGKIESAATMGKRYDPADLANLVSGTPTNSGWTLIKINAGLAAGEMYDRRFQAIPDDIKTRVDEAQAWLAELADGTQIFAFAETQAAGLLQERRETAVDVANRNMPSYQANRLFGRRNNVSPGNWNPSW